MIALADPLKGTIFVKKQFQSHTGPFQTFSIFDEAMRETYYILLISLIISCNSSMEPTSGLRLSDETPCSKRAPTNVKFF